MPIPSSRIVGVFDIWPFALLVYDCLLTLDWEISRYWGEAFTLTVPNVLFFANRYGTLLGNIPVIIPYFWTSQSLAEKITMSQFGVVPPIFHRWDSALVGVMLFLRTYALYEQSKRALVLMLGVAVGALAVGLWAVITSTSDDTSVLLHFGCNFTTSRSEGNSLAVAWAGVTVFDSMIFILTLFKVLGRHHANGRDLFIILLRDGSLYFGVMVMSNLANILTLVIGNPYSRGYCYNLYEHHLFDHDKPAHAQPPRPHARTHVRATAAEHDNYGKQLVRRRYPRGGFASA
ncbi:hypothetical protein B0H14DRAFT_1393101 [Mycena olivaceomarginata]|nr:hypothetical protein B0H14DRAFT_1393101 [Mycena olivaceomarginata]